VFVKRLSGRKILIVRSVKRSSQPCKKLDDRIAFTRRQKEIRFEFMLSSIKIVIRSFLLIESFVFATLNDVASFNNQDLL
jgi:hypothetical protein